VIQIVPYFMTGFESVPKCAEEAQEEFDARHFMRPILLALAVGAAFYISVVAVVGYLWPWPALIRQDFATAVAFEQTFRARWITDLIMAAALVSLIKIFNGNFVVASRVLFALGREGLAAPSLGKVHPRNQTPAPAVLGIGMASAAALFLGPSILIPVTEVGSVASALGWFAACAAYYRIEGRPTRRSVAWAGGLVALAMLLMKALPFIPGHFTRDEGVAPGLWALLGGVIWLAKFGTTKGVP
jgi:amino acid transporter